MCVTVSGFNEEGVRIGFHANRHHKCSYIARGCSKKLEISNDNTFVLGALLNQESAVLSILRCSLGCRNSSQGCKNSAQG